MSQKVSSKTFLDSCFLHNNGYIYEGANFLPRQMTIVSNHIDVLTLDAENYLTIFHPGSVTLVQTLKGIHGSANDALTNEIKTNSTDPLVD